MSRWPRSSAESCRRNTGHPSTTAGNSPSSSSSSLPSPSFGGWGREKRSRKKAECLESWDMCTRKSVCSALSTTEPSENHRSLCRLKGNRITSPPSPSKTFQHAVLVRFAFEDSDRFGKVRKAAVEVEQVVELSLITE